MDRIYDSLIHVKSSADETGSKEKKQILPITRWENVVGSPRTVTKEQLSGAYVADYLWYLQEGYLMETDEYEKCFGDL